MTKITRNAFIGTILSGAGWVGHVLLGHHCNWISMGTGTPPETIEPADKTSLRGAMISIELRNKETTDHAYTNELPLPGAVVADVLKDLLLAARYHVHAYPTLMPDTTAEQTEKPRYEEVTIRLHLRHETLKGSMPARISQRVISVHRTLVAHDEVWQMALDSQDFFVDALKKIENHFPHWD